MLPFVLDTGASSLAIPEDVFLTLTRTGTIKMSDFVGTGTVVLADGSEHASRLFVLHEVQVGNHAVRNVIASVVSVKGDPLLGQSFLSKLPGWAINNHQHTLILNDQPGPIAAQPNVAPPSQAGALNSQELQRPQPPLAAPSVGQCSALRALFDARADDPPLRASIAMQLRQCPGYSPR